LCEYIDRMKLNWKLLIYDNNTNMIANYGLDVVTGDNYAGDKINILKKKKVVVAEPFQSIIQDVISSKDAVDVVVVYDRLRQYEDIVKGNNVTKFFIANSGNDNDNAINIAKLMELTGTNVNGLISSDTLRVLNSSGGSLFDMRAISIDTPVPVYDCEQATVIQATCTDHLDNAIGVRDRNLINQAYAIWH